MEKTAEGENVQRAKDRARVPRRQGKMMIPIHGYSLSKNVRHAIMKKLMDAVERSPDRLIADANEKSKKGAGKKLPGHQKAPKLLEEVGD
jgi:hypothetical protein